MLENELYYVPDVRAERVIQRAGELYGRYRKNRDREDCMNARMHEIEKTQFEESNLLLGPNTYAYRMMGGIAGGSSAVAMTRLALMHAKRHKNSNLAVYIDGAAKLAQDDGVIIAL